MAWFYLSFADNTLPKNQQWLGAVIVQGSDMKDAIENAWILDINPGGEVLGMEIEKLPSKNYLNRLLDRIALRAMGEEIGDTRAHNGHGEVFEL
jgi:hypothetical protein